MQNRTFGATQLSVSEVGFGAWGIGGPASAGSTPIGWGEVDDEQSKDALRAAYEQGITFYDTADFYGLGHSEEVIGEVFGSSDKVIIATKAGHKLDSNGEFMLDYSYDYLIEACENSLQRLQRDTIDYYQLHSARMPHLEDGGCIEAMEQLQKDGKIRYWGISLNTFDPSPEAEFFMERKIGHGFQIVLNVINQRALPLIRKAGEAGYGVIARMPLQFGLLTGKFTKDTRFGDDDHRAFRLPPPLLARSLDDLEPVWKIADELGMSKTEFSLSFILSIPEVSTVIPGIKTPAQAEKNTSGIKLLDNDTMQHIFEMYDAAFSDLMTAMEEQG